jgi:muramoyltetrapeptide carboxypeptidase
MTVKRILPRGLSKGDTIGIISPAGPVDRERLKTGIKALEELGYSIRLGRHVVDKWGYLAGKDEDRLADLHWAFADDEVDAVFCARGGYGTNRIISGVDFNLIRANPKILLGYSDITGLHIPIYQKTGLVVFQGPMVVSDWGKGINDYSFRNLFRVISGREPAGEVTNPGDAEGMKFIGSGRVSGPLTGGNLSLLITTLGTPYEIDTRGKVLVIEDIDEDPYAIDRYLRHLHNAGKFDTIAGLVLGSFTNCVKKDSDKDSFSTEEVFNDFIKNISCPIVSGLTFGHSGITTTIPIGINAAIDIDDGRFTIEEGAVI